MDDDSGLDLLVDAFLEEQGGMLPNPPDPAVMLNQFLYEIQKSGNDLSSWDEEDWREALLRFGFAEEDLPDALENLASWGVVDNFVWEVPED
jgi:hypothetical protein